MRFGDLLKRLREARQFTLRDLGTLSKVDHAYVHRLETGAKSAPSGTTFTALTKALKLDHRTAEMLWFLAWQEAPATLVGLVLDEPEHALVDFASAVAWSRQNPRPRTKDDWRRLLGMIRGVREEFEKTLS